ncbi:MAG: serine hydrolase domain-containing protein [Planctomycetota bacterium]
MVLYTAQRSVLHRCSLVALALAGCHTGGAPTDAARAPRVAPLADYQPPAFVGVDRRAAVLASRPSIDGIFRSNAEAQHYVGQVWGAVVDGELVFVDAFGVADLDTRLPVDEHTAFHIASLTKSFTSLAILKLRDDGALSLQDPVARYLPELAAVAPLTDDAPPIVLAQLMTMTSGLPEDNPWADRQLEDSTDDLRALLAAGLSFSTVPGSAYEYSNLGYALLGEVITRVAGRPYQRFITEELLEPLGMLETYWDYDEVPEGQLAVGYRWEDEQWKREPMLHTGAYGAIGGLITSLHDMALYVGFHLSAWPARTGPDAGPVRRATVREMHVPTMPRLDAAARDGAGGPCPALVGYGFGLGVRTDCNGLRRVSHTGGLPGFGSNIQFFPDQGIGVISFANLTYAASSAQHTAANEALARAGALVARTLPVPPALAARARQVAALVQGWDEALERELLADNVYLDRSRDHRRAEAASIFEAAGAVRSIDAVTPLNQLRGSFVMRCVNRDVQVTFTQSPERPARVQRIDLRLL